MSKNVLTPVVSFRIDQITGVWFSDKIVGTIQQPPDFTRVTWIKSTPAGDKYELAPNNLVTDLIVVVDANDQILGYLNKLFNFSFVKQLQIELAESVNIVDKEVAIDIKLIYSVHAQEEPSVHTNFFDKVGTVGFWTSKQIELEAYEQGYQQNPLIKENKQDAGQFTFSNLDRPEAGCKRGVKFPFNETNFRIGFSYLDGVFLYKIDGDIITILTPESTGQNAQKIILQADRQINSNRVFYFAGGYYLVSDGALLYLTPNYSNPDNTDYTGNTTTREILDGAAAFEFSFLGDMVLNTNTGNLFSVLLETESNQYNYFYQMNSKRLDSLYKICIDQWRSLKDLSDMFILGNSWCLFRHKHSGVISGLSNYPKRINRRNFKYQFRTLDNSRLHRSGEYLDLETNVISRTPYIDSYLGLRLIKENNEFIVF